MIFDCIIKKINTIDKRVHKFIINTYITTTHALGREHIGLWLMYWHSACVILLYEYKYIENRIKSIIK